MEEKYNAVFNEHFANTETELFITSIIRIADLPTNAVAYTFTEEQSEFLKNVFLKRQQGWIKILYIRGFASEVGAERYNLDLSMKRANDIRAEIERIVSENDLSDGVDLSNCRVDGVGELVIPNEDINTPNARKVEIKFSYRKSFPKENQSCSPSSTLWRLYFGHEVNVGLPIFSFGEATLTLRADADNYNGAEITKRYEAQIKTWPIFDLGFGTLLKKLKGIKKLEKKIEELNENQAFKTIFGEIEANFTRTREINKTPLKEKIHNELQDYFTDQLRSMGISYNIGDWPEDNGFMTSFPVCFDELTEIELAGIDIGINSPLNLLTMTISFYYLPGLNVLYTNFGLAINPGVSVGGVSADLKWITLKQPG